jgi:hypothetical protein
MYPLNQGLCYEITRWKSAATRVGALMRVIDPSGVVMRHAEAL